MTQFETNHIARGFGWGVVATVIMSIPMIIGTLTGVSPMPRPIPAAIVGHILGPDAPQPLLMVLAIILHLGYGGFWGAVLASLTYPVTLWKGLAMGVFLWLVMQIIVLPFLGWGAFGASQTPMIALATFVLHLIYGGALGLLLDRHFVWSAHPHQPAAISHTHRPA